MKKLPISALVASYNEGNLLEDCLRSIQFCDEIVLVNLGSKDNSMEIGKIYATSCIEYHPVSLVEDIHPVFIPQLKNDWILLIDPDERIMEPLAIDIGKAIEQNEENIVSYRVPFYNYFKGKRLKGTYYGGLVYGRLLYKKTGISLNNNVHAGILMKAGFDRKKINFTGENFDKHLWCNSWKQLFEKHRRYLLGEGQTRYAAGDRYSLKKQLYTSILRFYYSFKAREGYKDGITGLLLSLAAARYELLGWKSLRKYQRVIIESK